MPLKALIWPERHNWRIVQVDRSNRSAVFPTDKYLRLAFGAALYALYKGDRSKLNEAQIRSINNLELTEVTGKCYGTTALCFEENRNKQELQNVTLIKKNSKIPCSQTKTFYTIADGQTKVNCDTNESTNIEKDPKFVQKIWEGDLDLPPGRPAGQEIEVTFSYDENQIMKCSYRDVSSGKKVEVDLEVANTYSDDEVDLSGFEVE